MNKYYTLKLTLLAITLFIISSCKTKLHDGVYSFEILATNDIHGRLFEANYSGVPYQYSLANVSTYVKQERVRLGEERVILIDVGDNLQGDNSVYYYNFVDTTSTHIVAKIFNYLGFEATVVGNHDIEPGKSVYDKFREDLDMPLLATNAVSNNTGAPYFEPYTIINKNGLKIAIIGMTNANIPSWVSEKMWSEIQFVTIESVVQDIVDKVHKKEKPHFVILAAHAGLGNTENPDIENPLKKIATEVRGVDVILSAHDHRKVIEWVKRGDSTELLVTEGGSRTSNLSVVNVDLKILKGKVVEKSIKGELIPMKDFVPDKDYSEYVREDFLKIRDFVNKNLGTLDQDIDLNNTLEGQNDYVNLLHYISLDVTKADVSFAAPLGWGTVKAGDINYNSLMSIYPYENEIVLFWMYGKEIKSYLEYSYDNWVNKKNYPFNYDSASGLKYVVHKNRPYGDRVEIRYTSDGSMFDPEKKYTIAMTSYRANGGGGLLENGVGIDREVVKDRTIEHYSDMRQLLFEYVQREGGLQMSKIKKDPRLGTWMFTDK